MAKIFDDILLKGVRAGQMPARSEQARNWFRDKAKASRSAGAARPEQILRTSQNKVTRVLPGRMYHFFYDPKTKEQLPYYDMFPLIFMVKKAPGGFYGLNVHYLPPALRAKLMDGLYDYVSDDKYDENTRLRMSYQILTGASKLRYYKPCFKRYLYNHVESRFIEVQPSEWDIALMLPTQRFAYGSKQKVWADSRKAI
jgi:hypothetical protein